MTLLIVSFGLLACREPAPPQADAVDPACRKAEGISPGTRLAAATDDATPRFAIKVRGPGEIGLAGFIKKHSVTIIDLATSQVAAHATTEVCRASFVTLPTEAGGYGEYCVVIDPLEKQGYSTFDLGFSSQPHTAVDAGVSDPAADPCGEGG
ncbi:MAG: hypothetical protein KIT84_19995 [Labilithrix sp.]|nr:hypothetical protein [Labilithrix sp.]MCW5813321.1 hypothetical protein [Labilithrix sp.]